MSDGRDGMHEREGFETLRRAIDDLADRMPARPPRRRVPAVSWAVIAASMIAAAAIATYRFVPRPAAPAPETLGIEVKLLRVRGRDVGARVFDAERAGTVVVAPAIDRVDVPRPVGALVIPAGAVLSGGEER
jgi:hypothetical protein